jgi:hypothetical protein
MLSPKAEAASSAKAGWAEIEITPPLGLQMGGRGPAETRGNKVLDPLYSQVLLLQDEKGAGMVVISLDLHGIAHELSEKIRLDIVHELGVDWNLVVLNTSHTHSGPQMAYTLFAGVAGVPPEAQKYFDSLEEKIILATRTAAKTLSPVKVEVFEGKSDVAISRRGKNRKGESAMVPNAKGPIAEKVWVLKLTPESGAAPAVIFSYACHPVLVYGYAGAGISADFPGVTRKALREKLGAKVHAQFIQGLAGDVRPRVVADVAKNGFRKPTPADVITAGTQLAGDVLAALNNSAKTLNLNIAGAMDHPFLPRDKPPKRDGYETMLKESNNMPHEKAAKYWLSRYDSGEGFAKGDAWPLGLIRLADNQWIVYFAGEPCVEWYPKVSKWLAPRDVVPWGYSQESITYLPAEEMLPEDGYEVLDCNRMRNSSPAKFAPGIDEAVRKSLIKQLSFIEAKQN